MSDAAAKPRTGIKTVVAALPGCFAPVLLLVCLHALLFLLGLVPAMQGLLVGYGWSIVGGASLCLLCAHVPKLRHTGLLVVLSALLTFVLLGTAMATNFKAVKVEGNSMQPYLQPGDVLLVDLTAAPSDRYGIYTLNLPDGDHAHVIKRLVGLPGEKMDVRYGRVFADDTEVYPQDGTASDTWNETRPANARFYSGPRDNGDGYFVLGDNPPDSRDSRHFGALDESAFEGRVVWSLRGSHGFGPVAFASSE